MYNIHMGVPEMEKFWNDLSQSVQNGTASKDEIKLFNRIGKALVLLSNNPRHPGLQSHEISVLTARYGTKVWCSYMQNNAPAAGRIFWAYGPEQGDITIVAIEPHPNDSKSNAYKKITLSLMQTKSDDSNS
ncbi:MAG: hypothetical protein SPL49_04005 [Oribacterium sp.]|jgi:hypothetical protein|nr:hypothetical protein [Oribacterium sp.]MDY6316363.1 hypothetical protein [Oribacterium sp.]